MDEKERLQSLYISLGELVVNFNRLELAISYCIWTILKWDWEEDYGYQYVVTNRMSIVNLTKMLDALIRMRFEDNEYQEKFYNLCKKANHLSSERDTLIHSWWRLTNKNDLIRIKHSLRMKKGLTPFIERNYEISKIKLLNKEFVKLIKEFEFAILDLGLNLELLEEFEEDTD